MRGHLSTAGTRRTVFSCISVSRFRCRGVVIQQLSDDCLTKRLPLCRYPGVRISAFRHSAIFIRTDRNIRGPADLKGKLVGLPEYQQTANVWMRGIFKEEYGLDPADLHLRTSGQGAPGR